MEQVIQHEDMASLKAQNIHHSNNKSSLFTIVKHLENVYYKLCRNRQLTFREACDSLI